MTVAKKVGSASSNKLAIAATKAKLPASALVAARTWMAEQLMAHEYAKLGQGGHTHNQVPLRQVFVDLPVTESMSVASSPAQRVLFLERLLSSEPLDLHLLRAGQNRAAMSSSSVISNSDDTDSDRTTNRLVQRKRRSGYGSTLLIGGPGQGKSTLGQLACQLHRAALLEPFKDDLSTTQLELVRSFGTRKSQEKERVLSLPDRPLFPLQISLPELAVWLTRDRSVGDGERPPALLRFLADLPSAKSCGLQAEHMFALVSKMPMLLVLDGFDEVGAAQDRERIVEAAHHFIEVLAEKKAFAQILATTRPQGYAGELAQLGIPLRMRYLVPLLREEALDYAKKLVEAKIPGADLREKALDRLHEAAREPATQRLLTTPLQVTILTALVQQLGRAPRERWNLFSRYFSYTYDREIERETYASRLLAEHRSHIEQIHARVALLLQVEAERDGGASARMPKIRLQEVIEAVLAEDEVSELDRADLVHEIAKAAEQRLVFLVEPEPGSFGFEIRSLQEFMAAWALTSGRDSEVEARLQQITKASMFRNVALFVASRLFSEGSPLRDVLSDRVCRSLDEDTEDPASHLSRAGGMLALETLEEGAVLSQPKRARALMERAVGLLRLPAGSEHLRLSRAANSDTVSILKDEVDRCLRGSPSEPVCNLQATVICLVDASNRGEEWAIELGTRYWHQIASEPGWLLACREVGLPLGDWIVERIESDAEKFSVRDFLHLPFLLSKDKQSSSWIFWINAVFKREGQHRHSPYPFALLASEGLDSKRVLPPEKQVPEAWLPWISVAKFEAHPSAQNLATALDAIAKSLPAAQWWSIQWQASWPLAACLAATDSAADLSRFANMLRSGLLGDVKEWRSAEKLWDRGSVPIPLPHGIDEAIPWSLASLAKSAPPFLAIPVWAFGDGGQLSPGGPAAMLKLTGPAFIATRNPSVQRWLAEVSLIFLRTLSTRAFKTRVDPAAWLKVISTGGALLVPRPKVIAREEWLKLLDMSKIPDSVWFFVSVDSALEAVVESDAHQVVLRMAVLHIELHSKHLPHRIQISTIRAKKALSALERVHSSDVGVQADVAILRLLLGAVPPEGDSNLTVLLGDAAKLDPEVWARVVGALSQSKLPNARASDLFAKFYAVIGPGHSCAGTIIKNLRDLLQKRRSDLDSQAMWNRLALPLPYPKSPLHAPFTGGIPIHPVVIESLEVKDVGGIHNLLLPFAGDPEGKGQWVVILGPNGVGKTTLLRSLALSLRNVKDPAIWPKGAFAGVWQRISHEKNDVRAGSSEIVVRLSDGVEHKTQIRSSGATSFTQFPEQELPRLFPLFAYGCRRGSALGGAAREVNLVEDDGPEIATLFDEGADLIHAETWLLQLEGDASKNARSKVIFGAITDALKVLLDLENIEVADRKVWVVERGKSRLPFGSLSDGYLTNAGWFLDLVARWITLAERCNHPINSNFLSLMCGLVLIDEIDLHLHPRWQIEIVSRTRRLLPRLSFVVTTHNPLTLVGAKAEEIWILSVENGRTKAERGLEAPMLLTGGQIYRRYFGINDIYPDGLGRLLQRFGFLSGYSLRSEAEQAELEMLSTELATAGIDPGWEVVPRSESGRSVETESLTARQKKEDK